MRNLGNGANINKNAPAQFSGWKQPPPPRQRMKRSEFWGNVVGYLFILAMCGMLLALLGAWFGVIDTPTWLKSR